MSLQMKTGCPFHFWTGSPASLVRWRSFVGFPQFREDEEFSYELECHKIPSKAKLRYSAEEIERGEAENEKYYLEKLDIYIKQRLRPEYQADLWRLDSPLKDVKWEKFGEETVESS